MSRIYVTSGSHRRLLWEDGVEHKTEDKDIRICAYLFDFHNMRMASS